MSGTLDRYYAEGRDFWNNAAPTFDDEPDHGLADPICRDRWMALLSRHLPVPPVRVADLGCGTGSITLELARAGYDVVGTDLSPAMIELAQVKCSQSGFDLQFQVQNAAAPTLQRRSFDVVFCRHLLWALPHPDQILDRWTNLLTEGGRLVLIEGFWHTGGGLHLEELLAALPPRLTGIRHEDLSTDSILWGGDVDDERHIVSANLPRPAQRPGNFPELPR